MLRGKKDAEDDGAREAEARPVDVKIKTSESGESVVPPNVKLLREIQDERWEHYEWVDAEVSFLFFWVHPLVFRVYLTTVYRQKTRGPHMKRT